MTENIVSAIIGGLVLLVCQFAYEQIKTQRHERRKLRVGNSPLQILARDFIYKYEPHKYSIEKIISDFGQSTKCYRDIFDGKEYDIVQYDFENAKVLFCKKTNSSEIISVTLFSKMDTKNAVFCRMSFEDDDLEMGKATINDTIIKDSIGFKNNAYTFGAECIIKANYAYRQIKHLTISYVIDGNYANIEDTKGQIVKQVCISQICEVTPTFSSHDTYYN